MAAPDSDFIRYRSTRDEAAFRALVDGHLAMVHAVALRRLGPHGHLAADVVQSVFSRLARVAGVLPASLIVAPWLHRQAVRLAFDTVRKETRRIVRENTAAMLNAPGYNESPPAALLDEALDQLPAADRSLLMLRYLEDRDYNAVAAALGSTPEAARKRITRSLEKLRTLLGRRGAVMTTAALTVFLSEQSARAAPATLAAHISTTAVRTAGSSHTGLLITTALMSHATALTTGAVAALLACGLFYQQREKEIERRTTAAETTSAALRTGPSPPWLAARDASSEPLPSTLPEIIAALERLAAGPNHRLTQARTAALLSRVPASQYLEFYLTAESRIHPVRWRRLVTQSARIWKDVNPAALTRALFESDSRKSLLILETALHHNMSFNSLEISTGRDGGSSMTKSIEDPFILWLEADFAAASAWLQSVAKEPLCMVALLRGETLGRNLLDRVAEHMPHDGPLQSLSTEDLSVSQTGVLRQRWADNVIKKTPDFGEVLTTRTTSAEEARLLAHHCAKRDPDACQRAIAAMPREDLRFAAALGFVSQYAIQSPDTFTSLDANDRLPRAKFALEQAGHRNISDALCDIVRACLEPAAKNNDAVRAWVIEKGGVEAGAALAAGARRFAQDVWSMPIAMEWAAAIPDAAQRGPLLRGIYLRWSDDAPEAASKYLQKAAPELAAQLHSPPASP